MNKQTRSYLWMLLGSFALLFMGWRWNNPLVLWLAPVFLMRFFREQERWPATLWALPAMTLALFVNIRGGWDFSIATEIGIALFRAALFLLPLYADRFLVRRLKPALALLVYPATYVVLDFLLSFSPLGTVFSVAVTQFHHVQFLQLAALTGIWGMAFLMGCFASTVNLLWEHEFDFRRAGLLPVVFCATLGLVLVLGGWRLATVAPTATVRVVGVTVALERDYWGEIIDQATPEDVAHGYAAELAALEDEFFVQSERAVAWGGKIVFWSEATAFVYPEDLGAFMERAQAFAVEQQVYFVPAFVVLSYGEMTADNKLVMITPAGEVVGDYSKTKSWYPSDSDAVIDWMDTPYGRVGAAICFDMDFPTFIHQAGKANVDIMLVPAFDWEPIKPFHTQVGLLRAVENGFSVIRQVNEGTSMAVDYQGRVLAYQDFFTTSDPLMAADLPIKGVQTLYGALGDWFAYLCFALVIVCGVLALRKKD